MAEYTIKFNGPRRLHAVRHTWPVAQELAVNILRRWGGDTPETNATITSILTMEAPKEGRGQSIRYGKRYYTIVLERHNPDGSQASISYTHGRLRKYRRAEKRASIETK